MAYILFLFGLIGALVGAWWTFNAVSTLTTDVTAGTVLGFIAVGAPGVSLFIGGVLMMALGEALLHLAEISRNSRYTLKEIDRLVDHVTGKDAK